MSRLTKPQLTALKRLAHQDKETFPEVWVDNAFRRPFLALENLGFASWDNASFYDTAFAITEAGRAALQDAEQ